MSNADVSAQYCHRAFVARNLATSASCPDTKAYLLELEQLWLSQALRAISRSKPRARKIRRRLMALAGATDKRINGKRSIATTPTNIAICVLPLLT
jgi:hypothetical protein